MRKHKCTKEYLRLLEKKKKIIQEKKAKYRSKEYNVINRKRYQKDEGRPGYEKQYNYYKHREREINKILKKCKDKEDAKKSK